MALFQYYVWLPRINEAPPRHWLLVGAIVLWFWAWFGGEFGVRIAPPEPLPPEPPPPEHSGS